MEHLQGFEGLVLGWGSTHFVVNLNNLSQKQVQEEQISLNLTQDTMRMHQLLFLPHLPVKQTIGKQLLVNYL
jgi:hypothetical protein